MQHVTAWLFGSGLRPKQRASETIGLNLQFQILALTTTFDMNNKRGHSSYDTWGVRDVSKWAEPECRLSMLTIEKPLPIEPCNVGLPPELLQIIFWYATGLPRGLERSLWETTYVPFLDSGWNDSEYDKRRTRERRAVWQVRGPLYCFLTCKLTRVNIGEERCVVGFEALLCPCHRIPLGGDPDRTKLSLMGCVGEIWPLGAAY